MHEFCTTKESRAGTGPARARTAWSRGIHHTFPIAMRPDLVSPLHGYRQPECHNKMCCVLASISDAWHAQTLGATFGRLLRGRSYDLGDEIVGRTSFRSDLVSLPESQRDCPRVNEIFTAEARVALVEYQERILRDQSER